MNELRHSLVATSVIIAGVLAACSHNAKPANAPAQSAAAQTASAAPLVVPTRVALKPSKIVYVARLFSEGQAHKLGFRTLQLSESSYDGKPAWLLAESRKLNTVELAESLYVSKVSLEPVHRVVHTADMDITTHYTSDSILTSFAGDSGGNVRVAVPNERNLVGNI